MKIINIVKKVAFPAAVIGAVVLSTGCTENANQKYVKSSGISTKTYDSLSFKALKFLLTSECTDDECANQFWQKAADDIKYKKIIDSVKQATIDSVNATFGIVEKNIK